MTSASPHEALISNWPVNPNDYVEYALWFIKDEGDDGWYDLNNYVKDAMTKVGYDIAKHQSLTLAERYTIAAGLLALASKHVSKTPFERWYETISLADRNSFNAYTERRLREAFEAGGKVNG